MFIWMDVRFCVYKTFQTTKPVRGLKSCPSCFVSLDPFSAMPSFLPHVQRALLLLLETVTCGKLKSSSFLREACFNGDDLADRHMPVQCFKRQGTG